MPTRSLEVAIAFPALKVRLGTFSPDRPGSVVYEVRRSRCSLCLSVERLLGLVKISPIDFSLYAENPNVRYSNLAICTLRSNICRMFSILFVFVVLTTFTYIGIVSTYECSKAQCWDGVDRTDASAMLAAGLMATKIVPCLWLAFNFRLSDVKKCADDWIDVTLICLIVCSFPAATIASVVGYISLRACLLGRCWNFVDAKKSLIMLVCGQTWDLVFLLPLAVLSVVLWYYDSKTISSNLAAIINFLHKFRKRKVFPVTDENDA